jgi:hypothetical protein
MVRLRAAKAVERKIIKPVRRTWQKKCEVCGTPLDVRRKVCQCGHKWAAVSH